VHPLPGGRWQVETTEHDQFETANVVVAIGGFQRPHFPPIAESFPSDLFQIHTTEYRNPEQIPPGGVLIVGSGTSGQQITEELYQAGREVCLAVGPRARLARSY